MISKGVLKILNNNQDFDQIRNQLSDFFLPYLESKGPLFNDKCRNNTVMDVTTVNLSDDKKKLPDFVYAAFLSPGLHQFLIYCPKTDSLFVKDVMIDLSHCEYFSEYP